MTILTSQDGSRLSVSRYAHESSVHRMLAELSTTLIPMLTRSVQLADANQSAAGSPEYAAVVALYFSIDAMRNQAIRMVQDLATDEPRYDAALHLLSLDANPEVSGFSCDSLHEFDIRVRQWRQNIYRFIRKIDANAPVLFTRTAFDCDPPRPRRRARQHAGSSK